MKYIVRTSKTPILDSIVILIVVSIFLFGFGEFLSVSLLGVSWDDKNASASAVFFAVTVVLFFCFFILVTGVLLARYFAARFFNVKTGDSRVELDTEKRVSTTYTDGKFESKKKWK